MDPSEATKKRKLRKQYLDAKKPNNNTNVSVKQWDKHLTFKDRRRLRKEYLDAKRFKSSSLLSNLPTTSNMTLFNDENDIPNHSTNSQSTRFLAPNANQSARTPLSTITNGIRPSNNTNTTPANTQGYVTSIGNTSISASTIFQRSTSIRLNSGSHKLKMKKSNSTPIPIVDLTIDDEDNFEDNDSSIICAISKDYFDHGDQNIFCGVCGAKLWKAESKRSESKPNRSFSLCCAYGKVELPTLKEPPPSYKKLFYNGDPMAKFFLNNIRRFNSMFSFTSMGGKVDNKINEGRGPPIFRLSGENYHSIGSLLPKSGSTPKFSQLYIYDTENEIANRQKVMRRSEQASTSASDVQDIQIISFLKELLDENNQLVKSYRMVRDCFHANPQVELKLRIIGKRITDGRTYNLPTSSEVAALIVGDIGEGSDDRDIVVETSSGRLKRINELHPSYLPLQYPLLFPYGDDGYRTDILHRGLTSASESKRPNLTMREFFAFRIQDRLNTFSILHNSRRLFQQFLVDGYTMIESERLYYIRNQQTKLRCATYENLKNIKVQGNDTVANVGTRMILPSSFTGGARYMRQNYLDAMSICKWFGNPDFFITVTCNPKWPEVRRFLKDTSLKSEDRPDILCRIFKIKLDAMIKDLKDKALLGNVQAVVYTIEFQKRGLPHSHICLFMHSDSKVRTIDLIDPYISAEIPKREEEPDLYKLVSEFMLHGPCGIANPKCTCMVDNKCSKNFPKKFSNYHSVDKEGFPIYRRRDDGSFIEKSGHKFDNRMVVPYNKVLLKRYQAHINVEWCNQSGSIKYLFKYINKGPDRATLAVVQTTTDGNNEEVDEIKGYFDCRYISACEATWRILGYDVHYRTPSVVRLPFHLPDKQQVVYCDYEDIDSVLDKPSIASSMFLSWMECNKTYGLARQLNYVEFPTKFVWKRDIRTWEPRKTGFSIGRIHPVSPNSGEAYFLRILLNKVKGPTTFEDIRTVNTIIYPTFRDACFARGLLDDDNEFINGIIEGSQSYYGYYLRSLFASMLKSNTLSKPELVWEQTWQYLADGILYNQRRILKSPELELNEDQLKNLTLFEIESWLLHNDSTLKKFDNMPYPNEEYVCSSNNRLILEELSYDAAILQSEFEKLSNSLTHEQRGVLEEIAMAVQENRGGVFFVYGYGGTGKTFLWKTLSAAIRSKGEIVLNVASSGIASLLLTGGRTAHSRFHISLVLNEDTICFIQPGTDMSKLLKKTSLIIWDEAPMVHKHAFEALDRTLRDVLRCEGDTNSELPFGGKVIVFGGDFRQILPVIKHGSRQQIVNASLSSSYLWQHCKILKLTKNMRLATGCHTSATEDTIQFSNWLLDIGEGKIGGPNDGEAIIEIPDDILIPSSPDPIGSLIQFVYPSILQHMNDLTYFQERAILAPKNEVVHDINDRLLSLFPGEEKEYLSSDSLCEDESIPSSFDRDLYSPDVLNALNPSGLPKHRLILKVGVPVMLLRNTDQKHGLCNGTRLQIKSLGERVIEAVVMTGSNVGYRVLIHRFSLEPTDNTISYKWKRR